MTMIQNRSERNCVDRESKHFDELLATALTSDVQPERALNEQILRRAQEAAAELQDKKLVHAFSGEDAILVNETQTYGNYRTTLIGIVSGKDLTDYVMTTGGEIRADRSYWLLAIEHADGTLMPDTGSPEYGTETSLNRPVIQGL